MRKINVITYSTTEEEKIQKLIKISMEFYTQKVLKIIEESPLTITDKKELLNSILSKSDKFFILNL